MAETYDAIIVGAGVMGASTAMQLTSAGLKKVLVLEKAPGLGFGSTGKSNAIFRQTYSHYETCLAAHESLEIIRNWGEFTGLRQPRADFRECGVVFLLPEDDPTLAEIFALHKRVGVVSQRLDAAQAASLIPDMDCCVTPLDLEAEEHECRQGMAIVYEPHGGYADPVGTTEDMLEVARGLGAEVRFNTRVSGILQDGGRATGVETEGGGGRAVCHSPLVVNCGGPWAMGLNSLAGAPLRQRILPIRAQKVGKRYPETLRGPLPVINDLINGINIRPDPTGTQVYLGSFREEHEKEVVADPDNFDDVADAPFRETMLQLAHHRLPTFKARGQITSYSGIYTVNQDDNHPVIDETELAGYFCLCGFSGHGFKLSPVVGMIAARKMLGQWGRGRSAVPLDFFNRDRKPLRSFWGGFFT